MTKRLNLIDTIVLVAATATGFTLGRAIVPEPSGNEVQFNNKLIITFYAASVAMMWTLALLGLNLTRYYTTRRELACRPGFSALVAVVVERTSEAILSAILEVIGFMDHFGDQSASLIGRLWLLFLENIYDIKESGATAGAVTAV